MILIIYYFILKYVSAHSHSHDSAPKLVHHSNCEVSIKTEYGSICGRVRLGENAIKYASFRGVPYGRPPIKERRFKELEDPVHWEGFLDTTEDSPACPQREFIYGLMTRQPKGQSEDCIYLNVHVPLGNLPKGFNYKPSGEQSNLPILVMVHGGGFQVGSGLTDIHGPEYILTKRVIVITFNYRINVFGFLSLGTANIPGNQGLRDVLKLLRWVQKNARNFGGDPDNVTFMGHGAGATIVHLLSLSDAAKGLFHKIVLMSGTAIPNIFTTSPKFAKEIADNFLMHLGINMGNSSERDALHDQLIETPIEDIMMANSFTQHDYGFTAFSPVEEKAFDGVTTIITESPLKLMRKNRGIEYSMLMGFTDNEIDFFKWAAYTWQIHKRIRKYNLLSLPRRIVYSSPSEITELTEKMLDKYFDSQYTLDNALNCYSDIFFNYPMLKVAEWRALTGAPGYLYKYSYRSSDSVIRRALWAPSDEAVHLEDLTMLFRVNSLEEHNLSFPPVSNDDRMKFWLVTTLTNFMRCSNPTCTDDQVKWPPLNVERLKYQDISQPMVYLMKELDDDEADMMKFLDELDSEVKAVREKLSQEWF